MKSEELFDIDRQINQIKRDLQQRQQKIAQWDVPLTRILKDKSNKEFYLSKKYSSSNLQHYLTKTKDTTQAKQLLQHHNQSSKTKVHHFKNDLRELQELIKKRNVFRLSKANRFSCKLKSKQEEKGKNTKKEFSKTKYETSESLYRKNDQSAFSSIKAQKLLEVYLQAKNSKGLTEETISHVKRYLGIGIQNTPFYGWVQHQSIEKNINKSKPKNNEPQEKHPPIGFKHLKLSLEQKRNIYYSKGNPKQQQFEQRLKRIMRYNEENIDQIQQSAHFNK